MFTNVGYQQNDVSIKCPNFTQKMLTSFGVCCFYSPANFHLLIFFVSIGMGKFFFTLNGDLYTVFSYIILLATLNRDKDSRLRFGGGHIQ